MDAQEQGLWLLFVVAVLWLMFGGAAKAAAARGFVWALANGFDGHKKGAPRRSFFAKR
jgi:hypothetical protein